MSASPPRNPRLARVNPYVPERMAELLSGLTPDPAKTPIVLAAGEPTHPVPELIRRALHESSHRLGEYPHARGEDALRAAIARWLSWRFAPAVVDPRSEVLPALGSREAIFALTHAVVDSSAERPVVVCPDPCYPIYSAAAILAGAELDYAVARPELRFAADYGSLDEETLRRTRLLFACSPNNPTGSVMSLEDWGRLFEWADRYDFIIAADECYSEIYPDEGSPPLGALAASARLGRKSHRRLVTLGSLSKRSSAPGLRSGYVAGDPDVLAEFLRYRIYDGSAMSPAVQAATIAAFGDEAHVVENRALYKEKMLSFREILGAAHAPSMPDGAFYFWMETPIDEREFVRRLFREENVKVIPGTFYSHPVGGFDPGAGYVRISLTAPQDECDEGARRLAAFLMRDLGNDFRRERRGARGVAHREARWRE